MSARVLLLQSATVLVLVVTGGLGLVGIVALRGTGIAAVALAAVVAACLGAGLGRATAATPSRQAMTDAAWRAALGTVVVLLVLSGSAALAGGAASVLFAGWGASAGLVWWLRRPAPPTTAPAAKAPAGSAPGGTPRPAVPRVRALPTSAHPSLRRGGFASTRPTPPAGGPGSPPPVLPRRPGAPPEGTDPGHLPAADLAELSVESLGQVWLRTAAALEQAVDPIVRARIVQRRRAALDELERRDPVGFAGWLTAGATVDSNPAQYLRGDSAAGSGTA